MSDFVGSNVPDPMPEYVKYMYKQFAKDVQRNIKPSLFNTKVFVEPDPETDSINISISHKELTDIAYNMAINNIRQCIADEANGKISCKEIAREIVSGYKDYIWHKFFTDWKKRKHVSDSDTLQQDFQATVEDKED